MKTRKVGKIVSLLVAIVLVATIMIPAASVLADSAAQKYPGAEWTEASSFAELRTVLNSAKTDGSKTYIKLTGKIDLPAGARYVKNNNKGLFLGEVLKLDKLTPVVWSQGKDKWTASLGDAKSAEEAVNIINESKIAPASTVNPFDPDGKGEYADKTNFYITVTRDNLRSVEDIFNFTETKYTNTTGTPDTNKDPTQVARDYPSYYDTNLIIPVGTDVVIDLNGQTIDGGQSAKVYEGVPDYIQSIFIVNGKLTVEDFVGGGKLTGATGYLADGTYDVTKFQDGIEQRFDTAFKDRHRFVNANFDYTNESSHHDSETPSSIKDGKYNADTAAAWRISAIANGSSGGYMQLRFAYYIGGGTVTEVRGGAVYVSETGEFTLNNGSITRNCTWMESNTSESTSAAKMMKAGVDSVVRGGGVYVEAGGTFNMNGGDVSNNAARAYQKGDNTKIAKAEGGGIYLEPANGDKVATFNMTAGKIAENAAYAETSANRNAAGSNSKAAESNGAGIYVGAGSVCNIMGTAKADGEVTDEMMASFPQITNNSCGAETRRSRPTDWASVTVRGGGVYCAGTLNIEKASISANDFAEAYNNLEEESAAGKATHIMRDEYIPNKADRTITNPGGTTATVPGTGTGLALYILDYNEPGPEQTPKTYITRLDPRYKDNLELATELVTHESSGIYGTGRGSSENKMITDGAGVCMADTGTINIGERVWIYDNYDLVTTGHKSFGASRDFRKYWVQEYTYNDPVVGTDLSATDASLAGKQITDNTGRYVYFCDPNNPSATKGINNGYCWSDTRDDVYLPEGVAMYKGGSLFECRIGVNYYNMVNAPADVKQGDMGQASNRVIVKSSTNLDPSVWGTTKSTPSARDIQFFYLNDNNKNYEAGLVDSSTKYTLPANKKPDNVWPCNPNTTASYDTRDRVAVIKADTAAGATGDDVFDDAKKVMSPYEGYVNYSVAYPADTWIYHSSAALTPVSKWYKYSQPTFRISDPNNYPGGSDTTVKSFSNAIVNVPQRAYQLTDEMIQQLPEAYRKAKYMDYKVVYDNDGFGSESAPVLRFGENVEREMYFTVDFDEANVHYYGESGLNTNLSTGSSIGNVAVNGLDSGKKTFVPGINSDVYYYKGSSNPQGTVSINPVVPDYNIYKDASILQARINNRKNEQTSITSTGKVEDSDLYFKGWSQYVSYGYKDESGKVVNASVNTVPQASDNDGKLNVSGSNTINGITALNYHNSKSAYVFDLSKIYNPNVNAQPCFSLTATWYTKEELAEARKKVSNVMFQNVQRANSDGTTTNLLRAVALAGSQYLDFDEVGFVISTTNATPTVEGGYDYIVKSKVYEKLGVNKTAGAEKTYYDVDKLLGGTWSGQTNVKIEDQTWRFTENSQFAANVTTGKTGKAGYKDAGLFYTNIVITDANKDTVYFVTPYAKLGNTYYYGESRGASYTDGIGA